MTQRCKLVWININSTGESMNQQNSDLMDHIRAELNSGFQLPKIQHKLIGFTYKIILLVLRVHLPVEPLFANLH